MAACLTVHWINRDQAPDEYGLRGSVSELPSFAALSPGLGTGNPTLIPLLDEAGIPFDSLTVEEQ